MIILNYITLKIVKLVIKLLFFIIKFFFSKNDFSKIIKKEISKFDRKTQNIKIK